MSRPRPPLALTPLDTRLAPAVLTGTPSGEVAGLTPALVGESVAPAAAPPRADLSVALSGVPTAIRSGAAYSYVVRVMNTGPAAATGATARVPLPDGLSDVTWTAISTNANPTLPSSGSGPVDVALNVVPGEVVAFVVQGTVSAAVGGTVAPTAAVAPPSGFVDPLAGNNTAAGRTAVTSEDAPPPEGSPEAMHDCPPELMKRGFVVAPDGTPSVQSSSGVGLVVGKDVQTGQRVQYQVTVANNGGVPFRGATIRFPTGGGLANISWTAAAAGGATVPASGVGVIDVTVDLPIGGAITFTVSGRVTALPGQVLETTVQVNPPPDFSNPPVVRQYNPDGTLRREILAYEETFTGGVRVATADLTGDGADDIITVPGPGGGPRVKVFDGVTGELVRDFFAFEPTFTGGLFVAAGDLDGDGIPQVIVSAGPGADPRVAAFDPATGAMVRSFYAYDVGFTGGVVVAAGDVNADGAADVITGPASGGGPNVRVFSGPSSELLLSFFAFEPTFTGGVWVAVGRSRYDGPAYLAVGAGDGGAPRVSLFDTAGTATASFLAYDNSFLGGVRVTTSDLDGDASDELLAGPGPGTSADVRVYSPAGVAVNSFPTFPSSFRGGVFLAGSPTLGPNDLES